MGHKSATSALSDDDLMTAYRGGDGGAFEALVNRYRGPLYGYLRRLLVDDALAEDALIETLFKLHSSAERFEAQGRFRTYLFTIAYREGISMIRRNRRHQGPNMRALEGEGEALHIKAKGPSPEKEVSHRRVIQKIEAALGHLPPLQRSIFLLYYREGMGTPDIASAVDLPQGSVRAYLCMARKGLRDAGVGQGLGLEG